MDLAGIAEAFRPNPLSGARRHFVRMTDRITKADVVQIVWQTALVARSLHVVRLGFLPNAPRGRLSHVAVKALRRRQKIHTSTA